ncbi:glycerophosphodiester phosphodiesterase [Paraburkholderia ginsengiterrae]|uniref:Glycerophosphodiester phosphodiesterase n=1 Tax=Paraburkholderia ginsengiterrae TaxID=1462993 RepID=A0A1A9NFF0_9BURK|nr:glycerophosphodiester phosphodiesterase [Paraburkholderia ginsengiterrae]OAJ60323.1 glycerophosphodiester phosphodiesterase [Paraburkholderia ginsengiterrae]OAJ64865.1 glycerophosphodiester phosphodiesterase [Paraburkholderia ginsengiterrae]
MEDGIHRASSAVWPYPRLVAHRCGGTLAPENTLAGFDACVQYGYRMVEFDAKLSADNQLFLLHDDTLERTTNGHGAAADHKWQELAALDAGAWLGPQFAGTRLPTLAEAAERCARDGIAANIEIKPCPGRDEITGTLVASGAQKLWQEQTPPLLSSFSYEALAAARDAAPSLRRGMLFEEVPADWLRIVRELDCVSLHASHRYLSEPLVAEIRAAGLRVLAYTVNDPARAQELAQWGVDMICTDRIDTLHHDMLSAPANPV